MQPRQSEGTEGKQAGNNAALHVTSAASVDAPVRNISTKWVKAPGRRIAGFDGVDVTVQDQRAPISGTPAGSHDIRPSGEIATKGDGLCVRLQLRDLRLPDVDIEVVCAH